jgi:hypothetical protein
MPRLSLALAVLVCAVASAPGQPLLPADFDRSDSGFVADETHTVTEVAEAPRRGWSEHNDSVRFGANGFSVVQRLDPATGLPSPEQRWGDSFVGIQGERPAFYMASNWSPWDFLAVAVRLRGDAADLPQPTRLGLLVHCGLREVTNHRIVAEAAWQDSAGGLTRAELVGWRGTDRFGLRLSYTAPAGREVESLRYTLVCQPYDYSDRGSWERRRWLTTPDTSQSMPEKPTLDFGPDATWQFVFHNRFAQNDAGAILALHRPSVQAMSVGTAGSTVRITLTPATTNTPLSLVLGDWVNEAYAPVADSFFQEASAVEREAAEVADLPPPALPDADPVGDADLDVLLRDHPGLAAKFAEPVRKAREELAAVRVEWDAGGGTGPEAPHLLARHARARARLSELAIQVRAEWVQLRKWEQG